MGTSVKIGVKLGCLVAAVAVLGGCSMEQEPSPESGFKVTVKTEGKPAEYKTELVHHVSLSREQLKQIKAGVADSKAMAVMLNAERDHLGGRMGLRVLAVQRESAFAHLGFEVGDIITALDRTALPNVTDVPSWVASLEQKRGGSATVQRRGEPHKLLYAVQRAPKVE